MYNLDLNVVRVGASLSKTHCNTLAVIHSVIHTSLRALLTNTHKQHTEIHTWAYIEIGQHTNAQMDIHKHTDTRTHKPIVQYHTAVASLGCFIRG